MIRTGRVTGKSPQQKNRTFLIYFLSILLFWGTVRITAQTRLDLGSIHPELEGINGCPVKITHVTYGTSYRCVYVKWIGNPSEDKHYIVCRIDKNNNLTILRDKVLTREYIDAGAEAGEEYDYLVIAVKKENIVPAEKNSGQNTQKGMRKLRPVALKTPALVWPEYMKEGSTDLSWGHVQEAQWYKYYLVANPLVAGLSPAELSSDSLFIQTYRPEYQGLISRNHLRGIQRCPEIVATHWISIRAENPAAVSHFSDFVPVRLEASYPFASGWDSLRYRSPIIDPSDNQLNGLSLDTLLNYWKLDSNDTLLVTDNDADVQRENCAPLWFYFQFREDMPEEALLDFNLIPLGSDKRAPDYDFAIYGPDLSCDSLAKPLRWSSEWSRRQYCLTTTNAAVADEKSLLTEIDGSTRPLKVSPGKGYYLFFFFKGHGEKQNKYQFTWRGEAATYLKNISIPYLRNNLTPVGTQLRIQTANGVFTPQRMPAIPQKKHLLNSTDGLGTACLTSWREHPFYDFLLDPGIVQLNSGITLELAYDSTSDMSSQAIGFCSGDSTRLEAADGFERYLWSDGQTSRVITVDRADSYLVGAQRTSNELLFTRMETTVYPLPEPIILGQADFCQGDSITLKLAEKFSSYLWSTTEHSAEISVGAGGTYAVQVTDDMGCSGTAILAIEELPLPTVVISGVAALCEGQSAELQVSSEQAIRYQWSTGATGQSIQVSEPGVYAVEATDANGCHRREEITVNSTPAPQFTLRQEPGSSPGASVELRVMMESDEPPWTDIRWLANGQEIDNNRTSILVTPAETTRYEVEISNEAGCSQRKAVEVAPVNRMRVFIPNAFTPNGDGYNDYFTVLATEEVSRVKQLTIFNSWGELVWQARDFAPNAREQGWNGTVRGQPAASAAYVYIAEVEYRDGSTEAFTGTIILIR